MPRKHETVYYNPGKSRDAVRARVSTVHRDGTYTITALFYVRADGSDVTGYLGYKYRIGGEVLRQAL